MHLTKFTDYALRISLYLAAHPERLVPIAEMARGHDLSHSNLMKVVTRLVEGGFVDSVRGRNGGVHLAKPAAEIRVGDMVRYMEGDAKLVDCEHCILQHACGLVSVLAKARIAFYKELNTATLADAVTAHPETQGILERAALA